MREKGPGSVDIASTLTAGDKELLLRIARRAVAAVVNHEKYEPDDPGAPALKQKAGAFVTLHLNGDLKGCIGFVEAGLPLFETVAEVAAKSAVADPRFESVKMSEVKDLSIEISVLSPLQPIRNPDEVEVGYHGVLIEKEYFRGLLLPQVATENGWNREQFLSYVSMKAGLDKNAYKEPGAKLFVFTAEVFGEQSQQTEENNFAKRT